MAANSNCIETVDFAPGTLPDEMHYPNTICVTVTGHYASKSTVQEILSELPHITNNYITERDIDMIYRLELPFKFYLKLKNDSYKEIEKVHLNSSTNRGKTFTIEDASRRSVQVTLHWVPPTFSNHNCNILLKKYIPYGIELDDIHWSYPDAVKTPDRRTTRIEVRKDVELPHYFRIGGESPFKDSLIMVSIPGRKTRCKICLEDTHWHSSCPNRIKRGDRAPPNPRRLQEDETDPTPEERREFNGQVQKNFRKFLAENHQSSPSFADVTAGARNSNNFLYRRSTPEDIPGLQKTRLTPVDGRNRKSKGKNPEEQAQRTDDESNTSERDVADDTFEASDESRYGLPETLTEKAKDNDETTTPTPTVEEEESTPDKADAEKEDETQGRKRSSTPTLEGPSTKRPTIDDSPISDVLVIDENARPSEDDTDKDKDSDHPQLSEGETDKDKDSDLTERREGKPPYEIYNNPLPEENKTKPTDPTINST